MSFFSNFNCSFCPCAFFNFLKDNSAGDSFTKKLAEKVAQAKENLTWRNQYMTFKKSEISNYYQLPRMPSFMLLPGMA